MGWTFGLVTDGRNPELVAMQIESIQKLQIQDYEIVVVGGLLETSDVIRHIPFDETVHPGWITRKKNLIAQAATRERVVISHDYIGFHKDWAAGFEMFGDDWNVACTRVEDYRGRRFYDWVSWDSKELPRYSPVPYSRKDLTKSQFIPGAYWAAKRDFMLKNPLNEKLRWGQSEDIEWSLRVRGEGLVFNPFSRVKHLKKHRGFSQTQSIYRDGFQIVPRPDYLNWDSV